MKNIVVNISNTAKKFFAKHNDIYSKFIENIKSIYYEGYYFHLKEIHL